jgi:structural maintenance of chromosome 2
MRIEELILEGFKSYPVRTQITGWDPSFNAITGLNGSGKSNILDAICFVLGLTNMSSVRVHSLIIFFSLTPPFFFQMRAQNQQDLIYKRGQAGITKASVTIVFDNPDRENSPPGMENYAQITVTRQVGLNISHTLSAQYTLLSTSADILLDCPSKYLQIPLKWPQSSTEHHPDHLSKCTTQHQ